MKKIIFFLCACALFSCSVKKTTLSPFVSVYKRDWVGEMLPEYIIIKTLPKTFEIYGPGISMSVLGEWNNKNDTLFLFPKYEYYDSAYHNVGQENLSIATIAQKYLIKKDCLIDVTDYDAAMPEMVKILGNYNIKTVYHRVNGK